MKTKSITKTSNQIRRSNKEQSHIKRDEQKPKSKRLTDYKNRKKLVFVLIILAFLLTEIILTFNRNIGVLIYVVLVGLILVDLEREEFISHSEKLLAFLTILPVARIAEFFISYDFFWKTVMFYFVICFLVIFYTRRFKVNPGYTTKKLGFIILTLLIGIYFGYAGNFYFGFEKHFALVFLLPFIALSEEILFRGMIQNYARKDYGSIFAIIFTSLLFAVFSIGISFKFAYFMFMANLIICLIYDKTDNIWLGVPINLFMNLFLFVMPIL